MSLGGILLLLPHRQVVSSNQGARNIRSGLPGYMAGGIDALESIPGLLKSFKFGSVLEFLNNLRGARNRVEIGLSYRSARLHSLAELVPWNRFLGSLKV